MAKDEKTTGEEFRGLILDQFKAFFNWLKPNPGEKLSLQIVKFILKIPVVLLMIAASPVLIVVLIFVFLIAL